MRERRNIEITLPKKYFRSTELEEHLQLKHDDILRYAKLAQALFRIDCVDLIHYPALCLFIQKYKRYIYKQDGKYLEAKKAAIELGISENAIVQMLAGSNAVYQIGGVVLINISEAEDFISRFRIEVIPAVVPEGMRNSVRGSRFVRDIMGHRTDK